jgi:hypothetical protein
VDQEDQGGSNGRRWIKGGSSAVERRPQYLRLVEEIDSLEDLALLIDGYWEWIFHEQLTGWMSDPELWLPELTREMFLEWFECELSTMIWDMLKTRIKRAF